MIRVVVDDIAFVPADAVIRPATTMLEPTAAALRHLEQVGGPAFWGQLKVQQPLAVGAAVVKIVLSLLAAFAYTHFRFRGRALLFPMTMITQMLPLPVRILPTYEMMADFPWINT